MIEEKRYFDNSFDVFLADTPESLEIHYNLRFRVYCDEMGYEDKERFPDRLEKDHWDENAVHFLVRHRESGCWLGAMRLVKPSGYRFPLEDRCTPYQPLSVNQYRNSVEISRLCVLREARRLNLHRRPAKVLANGEVDRRVSFLQDYKSLSRSVMWGLYRAAVVYCQQTGIRDWYILVTPSLAHAVKREGFEMTQIAEPCGLNGVRTAYRLSVAHILKNPIWEHDYKRDFLRYSDLNDEFAAYGHMRRPLRQIGSVSYIQPRY